MVNHADFKMKIKITFYIFHWLALMLHVKSDD